MSEYLTFQSVVNDAGEDNLAETTIRKDHILAISHIHKKQMYIVHTISGVEFRTQEDLRKDLQPSMKKERTPISEIL